MKVPRETAVKLLSGFILSFLIFVVLGKTLALASSTELTVDVNQIIADVSNNPIGINLIFTPNKPKITEPLKDLNVGSLRFPGGEIADYYLFDKDNPAKAKASLQDPNLRPTSRGLVNIDGTYKSALSFDDFMSVCQSVGAEPFIMVGIDAIAYAGTAPHATPEEVLEAAVEWVKYANIVKEYGIEYWEIGNENDLQHDLIDWTAEDYAKIVIKFSRTMKAVDPSIKIGANGMTGSKWWDQVMPIIKDDVDFLVTHQYSGTWIKNYQTWKNSKWVPASNIKDAIKAIHAYNPNLKLNVSEFSAYRPGKPHPNNTWNMLYNFEMLGNILLFNEVDYAHFWTSLYFNSNSSVNKTAFDPTSYKLLPMGTSLKFWGNYLKKKMVYASKSATISSWASYDPHDGSLNLFLLNKDTKTQKVSITLNNYLGIPKDEHWVLEGSTPESKDVFWREYHRSWRKYHRSFRVSGSKTRKIETILNPLSVTVIAFE